MEIIPLTKDLHKDWSKFCDRSDDAWFWHTIEMLEYTLNYNPKLDSESLYFFVNNKNETLAIAPLIIENKILKDKKVKEFSFGGGPLPAPALKNNLDKKTKFKLHTFIFDYIDSLSEKHNALKITYKLSPLSPSFIDSKHPKSNHLTRYSFIDTSLSTRIINLQKSREYLLKELRRNHRRGINKIKNKFEIIVYNKENITHKIFDEYRLMHKKAAGQVTRPLITFEKMYQWIKNDLAILVVSKDIDKDKYIGFEHYSIYKNNVYGFSAANAPKYSSLPIRHLIEWEAMLWLKERGCKYYDIGPEYYGAHLYESPSEKEINISQFKQGFGGFAVPFFIAEKYYSSEYFKQTMTARIKNFDSRYNWEIKTASNKKNESKLVKKTPMPIAKYTMQELEEAIKKVASDNEGVIKDYLSGKTSVINYITGKVKRNL